MLPGLLLFASAVSMAAASPGATQSAQATNNEFIFSQYPPRALAAGEQGSVRFRAEVDAKGNVLSCKVTEGSGHERLDVETCDLIVNHATFKPVLDSEGKMRAAVHDGIVNWRIPGSASPVKIVDASTSTPDKVICKRVERTGSLVARSRVCMTARQWSQQADQYQDDYGAIQGRKGSSRGD